MFSAFLLFARIPIYIYCGDVPAHRIGNLHIFSFSRDFHLPCRTEIQILRGGRCTDRKLSGRRTRGRTKHGQTKHGARVFPNVFQERGRRDNLHNLVQRAYDGGERTLHTSILRVRLKKKNGHEMSRVAACVECGRYFCGPIACSSK